MPSGATILEYKLVSTTTDIIDGRKNIILNTLYINIFLYKKYENIIERGNIINNPAPKNFNVFFKANGSKLSENANSLNKFEKFITVKEFAPGD
jgi:hypothetical protein